MNPLWTTLYAPITVSKLAAQDASAFIVDSSGSLYKYDDNYSSWVSQPNLPSTSPFTALSASRDGSFLGVCNNGEAYLYHSSMWTQVNAFATTVSAAVGDGDHLVYVNLSGTVSSESYSLVASLGSGPVKVSATSNLGYIYGIGATGTVYKWNPSTSSWSTISGNTLTQLHVSVTSLGVVQVVGVDSIGRGWSLNTTTGYWSLISNPMTGGVFKTLEAGDGYLWALLTSGAVYRAYI